MGNNESKAPETSSQNQKDKPARAVSKTRTFNEPSADNTNGKKNGGKTDRDQVNSKTKLAFEDWLYERLAKYFEDIQEKVLKPKTDKEERTEIGVAADDFLDFLFTQTEAVDRRLKVNCRDIIKVGTYHEDLDIVHVDELHYCIVIDDLSAKENIDKIEREIKDNDEVLKVYVTDNCAARWEECVVEEMDRHWLKGYTGLATIFFETVAKAVENVRSKARATIYKKHGRFDLLEENGVTKRGASVALKFTWNKEAIITVVLTPCLGYDKILDFVDEDCTLGKHVHKELRSAGKLLAQPAVDSDNRFQWNFGHTEKEYLKNHVTRGHKGVFQMIKFFVQGYNRNAVEEAEFFSELVIKTLVVIHDQDCKVKDRFADCVMAVIDNMRNLIKAFDDGKIPIFLQNSFYKYQNVMPMACRNCRKDKIHMNLVGLEQIANHLINDVGCTPFYDFEKLLKDLIPLNAFILKKDYIAKKYGTGDLNEEGLESKKDLIDAVGKKKFTVQF